jgi:hypothetical protein
MTQCVTVLHLALVAGHQAPAVLPPRVRALTPPASCAAPELPPGLLRRRRVMPPLREERRARTRPERGARPGAVLAALGPQTRRGVGAAAYTSAARPLATGEGPGEAFHCRRGRLRPASAARRTRAICQDHQRRPLAACGLAPTGAPGLATPTMPSTTPACQRLWRASCPWSGTARQAVKRPPLAAHAARRRWTARLGPSRSGRSLRGAPAHSPHRRPSAPRRSRHGGRPPRVCGGRWGSGAALHCHGLSVAARQAIGHLRDLVSDRIITTCQPA